MFYVAKSGFDPVIVIDKLANISEKYFSNIPVEELTVQVKEKSFLGIKYYVGIIYNNSTEGLIKFTDDLNPVKKPKLKTNGKTIIPFKKEEK